MKAAMNPYITDVRRLFREANERELGIGLSVKEVTELTGATNHQLRYWRELGLVWPSIQEPDHTGVPCLYSLADVERIKGIVSQRRKGQHNLRDFAVRQSS